MTIESKGKAMNWDKPLVAHNVVYVSKRVKRLLSKESLKKQNTLGVWMGIIHPIVEAQVRANADPQAKGIGVQITVIDKLLAKANCLNDPDSAFIPYAVLLAFEGEDMSKEEAWHEIVWRSDEKP
jgi:hypothetical protein